MKRYPAGAEWRKWDLHVHVPGTILNDGYKSTQGTSAFDRFADVLEQSDVAVFGITDYFSADTTLKFINHFRTKFPRSEKLLLVNIELRLNETVNGDNQLIDFHVIFRDSVSKAKINEFLSSLKTPLTDAQGRARSCAELSSKQDFRNASVTREAIQKAFEETWGKKAEPSDFLLYLAPANNNGLRAERGNGRKAALADETDKVVHAIFGKDGDNVKWYLSTERFEDEEQASKPKPVFGGCDAHSFEQLEAWLGKVNKDESNRQVITWVKSDPTFEGLQQTLVEPSDRVSIAELKPDAKEPYKVIRRVTFSGSNDFPDELVLNPNLNAIIGSRSSGKSALLAHIAHAIGPEYTIAQQIAATKAKTGREVGPAAGKTWDMVKATVCTVEWSDGSTDGRVIYIPQNWLYQISENSLEVSTKIEPVLEAHYPTYFREHARLLDVVKSTNETVRKQVERWFELAEDVRKLGDEIKQVGDKASIAAARDAFKLQVEVLRAEQALSPVDLAKYQAVVDEINTNTARLEEIKIEVEQLDPYTVQNGQKGQSASGAVRVDTYLTPDLDDVPERLGRSLGKLIEDSDEALVGRAESAIVAFRIGLTTEEKSLRDGIKRLQADNKELIDKHEANVALDELVKRQKTQQSALERIEKLEKRRTALIEDQTRTEVQIGKSIESREDALKNLQAQFAAESRALDQLTFGVSLGFDPQAIRQLSEPFRKNETGIYLAKGPDSELIVDVDKAQTDPKDFLENLFSKKQKLNQGYERVEVAKQILSATEEVRFTAELDQDRIGGFTPSTMTPGKQALFALTLILGEAEDRWALLIDQPEDDLDSRSIYGEIVRYLVAQKKQRQIILVTHNANLVVGADAEEVIVANRHGDDRKNRGGRTFDYLTGSLEHSTPRNDKAKFDLDRMGMREHAVEILDGGEEAFQKRRDKYKI